MAIEILVNFRVWPPFTNPQRRTLVRFLLTMASDIQVVEEETVTEFKPTIEYKLSSGHTLELEQYGQQKARWPKMDHHILATYTDTAILVYQAFNHEIADYAVTHQKFSGAPGFSDTRMTWIKPNFLWMMYRSSWATAKSQERILGIWLKREAFHELLKLSEQTSPNRNYASKHEWTKAVQTKKTLSDGTTFLGKVNIQWDPDHTPNGGKSQRRAIQIGIKQVPWWANGTQFEKIIDVTELVSEQRRHASGESNIYPELYTPHERIYIPDDPSVAAHASVASTEAEKQAEADFLLKHLQKQ